MLAHSPHKQVKNEETNHSQLGLFKPFNILKI